MPLTFANPVRQWTHSFAMLAIAVFGVGFFFGVQLTLFNNFVVERLGIEPHQLGFVEALMAAWTAGDIDASQKHYLAEVNSFGGNGGLLQRALLHERAPSPLN